MNYSNRLDHCEHVSQSYPPYFSEGVWITCLLIVHGNMNNRAVTKIKIHSFIFNFSITLDTEKKPSGF